MPAEDPIVEVDSSELETTPRRQSGRKPTITIPILVWRVSARWLFKILRRFFIWEMELDRQAEIELIHSLYEKKIAKMEREVISLRAQIDAKTMECEAVVQLHTRMTTRIKAETIAYEQTARQIVRQDR